MIEKLMAVKIISACIKHKIAGDAYAFGDQIPTFSRHWAASALENLSKGLRLPRGSSGGHAMSSEDFFKLCGFSSYTDIDYNGKAKLLLDLGRPLPGWMYARADLCYDGGVIEHIPNCFQAMCNAALLVKRGGVLIEAVPTACFGESYYNIDPLMLRDFYGSNGFEMIECLLYFNNTWYYSELRRHVRAVRDGLLAAAKKMVCPWVPRPVAEYGRRLTMGDEQPFDRVHELGCLDPFDAKHKEKIHRKGMPPRTHVIYLGIKRSEIEPETIKVPTQEVYPRAL